MSEPDHSTHKDEEEEEDHGPTLEVLRKECRYYETELRTKANLASLFDSLEEMIQDVINGRWAPESREYWQRIMLPKLIVTLLKRGDLSIDTARRTNVFFQQVIHFTLELASEDVSELFQTLARLLSSHRKTFYLKSPASDDDETFLEEEHQSFLDYKALGQESVYLAQNVKWFLKNNGLNIIMDALKSERKADVNSMKWILKTFVKIHDYLLMDGIKWLAAELKAFVFPHILNLTDEELKSVSRKAVSSITRSINRLLVAAHYKDIPLAVNKFELSVAHKFLVCPYLEKRLCGLNDIKSYIVMVTRKEDYHARSRTAGTRHLPAGTGEPYSHIWISSKFLVDWILGCNVMEIIYANNIHQELLKRAGDIPRFLASQYELKTEHIDMMWNCTIGKHETIRHIIYTSLEQDLIQSLIIEQVQYLFEKTTVIPFSQYDPPTFAFQRALTARAFHMTQHEKDRKRYGLDLMWQIIQDETDVPQDTINSALEFLYSFLSWPACADQRVPFMQLCVEQLRNGKAVSNSLKILIKIIESYPLKADKGAQQIQASVIEWLETQFSIVNLYLHDLVRYKTIAKSAVASLKEKGVSIPNLNHVVFQGKPTHEIQMQTRVDFLEYILSHAPLLLATEQLDIFWSSVIADALTIEERDAGFQWLLNSISGGSDKYNAFSSESLEHLLTAKVPTLDFRTLSQKGFVFVECLMRNVNWYHSRFEHSQSADIVVADFEILGVESIWRIILENTDNGVGILSISFLNALHKRLSPKIASRTLEYRERYIATCMSYIKEAASALQSDPCSIVRIHRCLTLLKMYISDLEGGGQGHGAGAPMKITINLFSSGKEIIEVSSRDTVGILRQKASEKFGVDVKQLRLISGGKELPVDSELLASYRIQDGHAVQAIIRPKDYTSTSTNHARAQRMNEEQDKNLNPSNILSNQIYFEQLFELLNLDANTAQMVWGLLMCLPTNSKLLNELRTFQADTHSEPEWGELLDPRSTFKLLYALQIVEAEMNPKTDEDPERAMKWRSRFIELGGIKYLINVLMAVNFQDESKGSKRTVCLSLLLKILNSFTLDEEKGILRGSILVDNVDISVFLVKLLETIARAAIAPGDEESQAVTDRPEVLVVKMLMQQFVACVLSSPVLQEQLITNPFLESWINTVLLQCTDPSRRASISSSIYNICSQLAASGSNKVHSFFFNSLLSFLPKINASTQTAFNYFDLLNRLLADACNAKERYDPSLFKDLLNILVRKLKEHPIVELQETVIAGSQDNVLLGILVLVRTLIASNDEFKQQVGAAPPLGEGLIHEVFHNCLFEIPTILRHSDDSPPKCKSAETRGAAFKLLTELSRGCITNFIELSDLLMSHHVNGHQRSVWKYHPASNDKAACGFVGLRNLCATCYMNSLMQQFYMIPSFRWSLFQVDDNVEKKEESTLYQLQLMMASLQESAKKYYDTRPFCNSYKNFDGEPINVRLQQDADEFMSMLLDKLETLLKGTPQDKMLANLFGGSFTNQFISKDCPHVSEREENFFALSLDVKGKKNINESLELYVQGDTLEGDNKYHCSQCDDKVDALKRCCISALPDNLIVHLKRFEFDLETMKRIKLNEQCVFPKILNMEPYTKEGLARKEGRNTEDLPQRPPSYYLFELAGILVHTGTADYGHYYSFIKERIPRVPGQPLRWYQFNDTVVEPFDEEDIPKACHGGTDPVWEWDATTGKQVQRWKFRPNNAYMLFYRRVEPITDKIVPVSRPEAEKLVPSNIYNDIWQDNTEFFHDKHIFDPAYFEFVWSVVSLQHTAPVTDFEAEVDMNSPWMKSIELGCRFLFETLSHAKEKGMLPQYVHQLKSLFSSYLPACKWFLEKQIMDPMWLTDIFLECTIPETSEQFAKLVVHIMSCLIPYERDRYNDTVIIETPMDVDSDEDSEPVEQSVSLVVRFLDSYVDIIDSGLEKHWKRFAHYFMVLRDFAKIGHKERDLLLSWLIITKLGNFYLGADSPNKTKKKKKKAIVMGEKKNAPKLEFMVGLFSELVRGCVTDIPDSVPPPPTRIEGPLLELPRKDKRLIYSEVFWSKVLIEGINPKECADMAVHLCWENENISLKFITILTEGIDECDFDQFYSYFEVARALLMLNDSLHQKRVEEFLAKYLQVIQKNMRYKSATRDSIKFLVSIAPLNSTVRSWLFNQMSLWLETWLLVSQHANVREEAENLVFSLVPRADPRELEERRKKDKDAVEEPLTEQDISMIHEIYRRLLSLLGSARRYKHGDPALIKGIRKENTDEYPVAYYKLTGFLRLLKWCVRGPVEKKMFAGSFIDLANLFNSVNEDKLLCDENKKELFLFWLAVSEDAPENVQLIINNDTLTSRLFDNFASLNTSKERMLIYNEESMPVFYQLMHMCCVQSADFLGKWAMHTNFNWALNHMYLVTSFYTRCAESLFPTFALAATIPQYRFGQLQFFSKSSAMLNTNPSNVLPYLDLLLKRKKDARAFCVHYRGLEIFSRFLYEKASAFKEEDILSPNLLRFALRVISHAFSWLANEKYRSEALEFFESWESKMEFIDALVMLADKHKDDEQIGTSSLHLFSLFFNIESDPYLLDQGLQRQYRVLEDLIAVETGRSNQTILAPPQTVTFTTSLCQRFYPIAKEEKQYADIVATTAILTAIWAAYSKEPVLPQLYRLLESIWDSDDAVSNALHQTKHLSSYAEIVLQQFPALVTDSDISSFLQRVIPHLISNAMLDFTQVADTLVQRTVSAVEMWQSQRTREAATNLFAMIKAMQLLCSSPDAKAVMVNINEAEFGRFAELATDEALVAIVSDLPSVLATFKGE